MQWQSWVFYYPRANPANAGPQPGSSCRDMTASPQLQSCLGTPKDSVPGTLMDAETHG